LNHRLGSQMTILILIFTWAAGCGRLGTRPVLRRCRFESAAAPKRGRVARVRWRTLASCRTLGVLWDRSSLICSAVMEAGGRARELESEPGLCFLRGGGRRRP